MAMPAGGGVALPEIRLPAFADVQKAALDGVGRGLAHVGEDLRQVSREPLAWAAIIVCATGAVVALRHPISVAIGTGSEVSHQPLLPLEQSTSAPATPNVTWSPAAAAAAGMPLPTHAPRDPFAPLIKVDLLAPTTAPGNAWVGVTGGAAAALSGPVATAAVAAAPAATPAPAPVTVTGTTSLVPTGSRKPVPTAASKAAATGPGHPSAVVTSPASTPPRATPVDTQPTRGSCQVVHVVKAGESLWRIAQVALHTDDSAKIAAGWQKIYDANRGAIGSNPNLVVTGTQLCMPAL